MGGQACILYGAAQFSRDTDLAVITDSENLSRLSEALTRLQAKCIALPPFDVAYLKRGHAVHFRCQHPAAAGMRIDLMEVMRGVDSFSVLWDRRTTAEVPGGLTIEVMALPDLVQAKKTQRDKDWPMIRLLIEANHAEFAANPSEGQILFWLKEGRTPRMLIEITQRFPKQHQAVIQSRPLLSLARAGEEKALADALDAEEKKEREVDRLYWSPLLQELEKLRLERRTRSKE
jgi:hypothetical protein